MSEERTLLDRFELHIDTGVGLLRIAAGLFFLVPGIFKIAAPEVFLAMTANFPAFLQPHLGWLFNLVIAAEVIGGLMLIVGWNIRLAVPALVVITLVAESLVVVNDTASSIRMLMSAHFMGAGLYCAMFFLGSGRWAVGRGRSVLHWLATRNLGRLSKAAHEVTSGAGRNVGVVLILHDDGKRGQVTGSAASRLSLCCIGPALSRQTAFIRLHMGFNRHFQPPVTLSMERAYNQVIGSFADIPLVAYLM